MVEKVFPDPFPKVEIEHISRSIVKVLYSLFLLYARLRTIKIY